MRSARLASDVRVGWAPEGGRAASDSRAEATGAPSSAGASQRRPSLARHLAGQGRVGLAAEPAGLPGVAGLLSRLELTSLPDRTVLGASRSRASAGGGGGQGGAVLRSAESGDRSALAINRACSRSGRIWGDRYHARELTTPREVRNALVYVLMNHKKHGLRDRGDIDSCSSAPWFDGFRVPLAPPTDPPGEAWLERKGGTEPLRRRAFREPTSPHPARGCAGDPVATLRNARPPRNARHAPARAASSRPAPPAARSQGNAGGASARARRVS